MIRAKTSFPFSLLLSVCLLAACFSGPQDAEMVEAFPSIYPDYVDVTIPVGIAPLNFAMADDSVTVIDVEVNGAWGGSLHSKGECTDFDIEQWHAMVKQNRGGQLNVTVCAKRDGAWKRYRDFCIHVAKKSLPDWGIAYRRVTFDHEKWEQKGIYERKLSTFEENPLLDNAIDKEQFYSKDELPKAVNDSVGDKMADYNRSSDSQWLIFTSSHDNGHNFHIYLSSIGYDGRATKPFKLPQRDPKRFYTQSLYSYISPNFINKPTDDE